MTVYLCVNYLPNILTNYCFYVTKRYIPGVNILLTLDRVWVCA